MAEIDLVGAQMLGPDGLRRDTLSFADGVIQDAPVGRQIDLRECIVLPGIVDLHGDGFERHLAPRRGAMKEMAEGLVAAEAELAANGITTALLAQFVSWEGGLRSLEFAEQVFAGIRDTGPSLVTDLQAQLRFEVSQQDLYEGLPDRIRDWGLTYVVFNDHLPHDRLAEGRRPPRLVGQALKAGRNPEDHFALLQRLHAEWGSVPDKLDQLCSELAAMGIRMGSHDENAAQETAVWHRRGVDIAEFPETMEAAEAARAAGRHIILGSPNVVRGGSHKGNVSAIDLIAMGLCDAVASDYHYPSPRRAALMLAQSGVLDLAGAWGLISSGPAKVLGLTDRGVLSVGKRADIVVLHGETKRVVATIAGGRFSYLSGEMADRFVQ